MEHLDYLLAGLFHLAIVPIMTFAILNRLEFPSPYIDTHPHLKSNYVLAHNTLYVETACFSFISPASFPLDKGAISFNSAISAALAYVL